MYKISVPIMSSTVNEGNRETYLAQCREAGAERVFLVLGSVLGGIPAHIYDNVAFFKAHGFEVGVWIDTIGHGGILSHVTEITLPDFTSMVSLDGKVREHISCPLDESFRTAISRAVAALGRTGADIVMLDDDFRLAQHGGGLFCACLLHLARIRELLGEEISLDELKEQVLSGKPNRYREAWLTVQNEGMTLLARDIRKAADAVLPSLTVCFCTAVSPWNVDGMDITGIAKILAGENKPLLRLSGAPYWSIKNPNHSLPSVIETARMFASFMKDTGIETMSEGDVYPRPRYTCPASYLELFDAAMRADGSHGGILKYMFDYVAGPQMETGYLALHKAHGAFYKELAAAFPHGANTGVRVYAYPHLFRHADLSLTTLSEISPFPIDGAMLASAGIPTVYAGEGACASVFGDNARLFDLSRLCDGVILDATSALILTERGADVGLRESRGLEKKKISFLCTSDSGYRSLITDGEVKMLDAVLAEGAVPVLFSPEGESMRPIAYRYQNAKGERFLVFLFEGETVSAKARSGIFKNPATVRALHENLPRVAGKALPAVAEGGIELCLLCEKHGDSLSLLLLNCFADPVLSPVLTLDEEYARAQGLGTDVTLDGRTLTLTSPLHGFSAAAVRLYK